MLTRPGVIKILSIATAACFLSFSGCRNAEKKGVENTSIVPADEHAGPESIRRPYYYGLIEEYRTMLAEDPKNFAAMVGLGNALFENGSWREAIGQYAQALTIDPHNADIRTDMGNAYRNIGMPERALQEYRLAIKNDPGHLDARYQTGIVYAYDFRDYGRAVRIWEDVLRLAPNYPQGNYMKTCIVTFKKSLMKEQH